MSHPHDKDVAGWPESERVAFEKELLRRVAAGRLEALMDDLEVSQKVLAARIGKSAAWVSKALNGTQNLTLDTMAQMAWALGVRWDTLLVAAPREGTPARDDVPNPDWVESDVRVSFYEPIDLTEVDIWEAFERSARWGVAPGPQAGVTWNVALAFDELVRGATSEVLGLVVESDASDEIGIVKLGPLNAIWRHEVERGGSGVEAGVPAWRQRGNEK